MKLNFEKAHRRLWNWLAENPDKNKLDWPEWDVNGGDIGASKTSDYCFPCEAAIRVNRELKIDGSCQVCPIGHCDEWNIFAASDDSELKIKYAKILAGKQWTGRKVFEI